MKIALIGYGKMGKTIERIALSRGHEIVCTIDVDNQEDFESAAFKSADVAIEFTAPKVAINNYKRAWKAGVAVVSGTTGWSTQLPEIKAEIEKNNYTLFWTSNFSLGVNIFFELNKHLAHIMNQFPTYNVAMTEVHHIHKLDAPSGTAVTLAEDILSNLSRKSKWVLGTNAADNEIAINAIREGEVPGTHTIRYESEADCIEITHSAKNREGLALGAVMAAEFTCGKKGFLSMNDMLKL
ncbi:MAG: 4-hydroxy-tetrahydrodipicolinate reductase [Sphingobacteriia bacterium]|jgi:4-hydroxy-tetrahydrodipicolinate reductase|nr:4-hydroxy-tetrahydrodipicolinate reductase [Paludibacteraceae bacterium]NCA79386.1 4-hydroxy-tetrahydrodipicolinate reductase [Sphingobacteriia bacterium]